MNNATQNTQWFNKMTIHGNDVMLSGEEINAIEIARASRSRSEAWREIRKIVSTPADADTLCSWAMHRAGK